MSPILSTIRKLDYAHVLIFQLGKLGLKGHLGFGFASRHGRCSYLPMPVSPFLPSSLAEPHLCSGGHPPPLNQTLWFRGHKLAQLLWCPEPVGLRLEGASESAGGLLNQRVAALLDLE